MQTPPRPTLKDSLYELFLAPALSVIVFLRLRVGFRLLRPSRIVRVGLMLSIYACYLLPLLGGSRRDAVVIGGFAAAFAVATLLHLIGGWRAMNAGDSRHTYSPGSSRIGAGMRFPRWLCRHRRVYRFIEPLLCIAVAACVFPLSPALGAWLTLAAVCLSGIEQDIYRDALARNLDIGDGLYEGEIQRETVVHYSGSKTRGRESLNAGIPTGIGPDIERQIARRRAEH